MSVGTSLGLLCDTGQKLMLLAETVSVQSVIQPGDTLGSQRTESDCLQVFPFNCARRS